MIKMKLSKYGGYVIGSGDCPFDPDTFYKAFASKITEAQMRGQDEVDITDEEVAAAQRFFCEDFDNNAVTKTWRQPVKDKTILKCIDQKLLSAER